MMDNPYENGAEERRGTMENFDPEERNERRTEIGQKVRDDVTESGQDILDRRI